jgi:predicted secreted hydrolase
MELLKVPKQSLLSRVKSQVVSKLATEVEDKLEKLQSRLRFFGKFIPSQSQQEISPALPFGHDWELFQESTEALKSWANKQTQWWYFTGHLKSGNGECFGFQFVTFERHAARDYFGVLPTRIWTEEFYVAHFAISKISQPENQKSFRFFQRGGLMPHNGFSSEDRFHVDLEGWQMHQNADSSFTLSASENGNSLNLSITPTKELCYHGHRGYTAKTERLEDGSLYCSYTRMKATGKLLIDGALHEVSGSAWMDHEKMASADEVFHNGWDWYSLQLSNNCELMLYLLKDKNGKLTSHAMGTFFDQNSKAHQISSDEIFLEQIRHWNSAKSNTSYPIENRIRIEKFGIDLLVKPFLDNQEMDTSKTAFVTYWEGAVSAEGRCLHANVEGRGYLELVGYDKRPTSQLFKFLTRSSR